MVGVPGRRKPGLRRTIFEVEQGSFNTVNTTDHLENQMGMHNLALDFVCTISSPMTDKRKRTRLEVLGAVRYLVRPLFLPTILRRRPALLQLHQQCAAS